MKLVWILCLCFVSFHQLACADDETSTLDTTLPSAENKSTSLDDVSPTTANSITETVATSTEESTTSGPSSTISENPAVDESTAAESVSSAEPTTEEPVAETNVTVLVNNMSNQIRQIIQHFQQPNPVGFPGQTVLPDPLAAPDVSEGFGVVGKSEFKNITVHGLSNFTVDSVNMLLDQMEVYVKIGIANIFVFGNCTLSNVLFSTSGPFNVTLTNVTAEGVVSVVVDADGSIRASRSVTKMAYQNLEFHLGTNATSSFLSSLVNAAGYTLISAIQPYIQGSIDERLTKEVNKQLRVSPKFPSISKISPIDLAIVEGRRYVGNNYDPYTIPNVVDHDTEFLTLKVGPVTLHGLSKFARVGDVSVGVVNRTTVIKMRMITGRIMGTCNFFYNFGKVPKVPGRFGLTKFSADHLQFEAAIHQPLNLTKKPYLEDLQLEVGTVNVQLDGHGNFDYLIELAVRLLPDIIRHFIIDTLEEPIKRRIQDDIFNKIDVEDLVSKNLPLFERMILESNLQSKAA